MNYCSNCGKELSDKDKFCNNCGMAIEPDLHNRGRSRQEYAGKVVKCPSCGAEVPSFTAVCPECGHEINKATVVDSIKEFSKIINHYNISIKNGSSKYTSRWRSWGIPKKIGWILLNVCFVCIPLFIYIILSVFGISQPISFIPEEKQKEQFIQDYVFPNDRESLIEALLFTKSQIKILMSSKITRKSILWIKIWRNKAVQLFERAEIIMPGDKISREIFDAILFDEMNAQKKFKKKTIISLVIIIVFCSAVFCSVRYHEYKANKETDKIIQKLETDADESEKMGEIQWPESDVAKVIPVPKSTYGYISWEASYGFVIYLGKTTQEEFKNYVDACYSNGFSVDYRRGDTYFYASNDEGYKLSLRYDEGKIMFIRVDVPENER